VLIDDILVGEEMTQDSLEMSQNLLNNSEDSLNDARKEFVVRTWCDCFTVLSVVLSEM